MAGKDVVLCPTCGGACDIIAPDPCDFSADEQERLDEDSADYDPEFVQEHTQYASIVDATMLAAVGLGRLQMAADTLNYRVEVQRIQETLSTSQSYGTGSTNLTQYLVYDDKGRKIGNGTTRLVALQRSFGLLQTGKNSQAGKKK